MLARKTEHLPQTEQMYFAVNVSSHDDREKISGTERVVTSLSEQFRTKNLPNLTVDEIVGDNPLQPHQIYESIVPESSGIPYSLDAFQILAKEHITQLASHAQNKENSVGANDIYKCFADDVLSKEDIGAFLTRLRENEVSKITVGQTNELQVYISLEGVGRVEVTNQFVIKSI